MLFAHTITYPELAKSKLPVVTAQGELIGGPDRKNEPDNWKWHEWQQAVKIAFRSDHTSVPARVEDYYQKTKHLSRPPCPTDTAILGGPLRNLIEIEDAVIVTPDGFKPPRFTWSYTSLQEFLTCPAQWAAKRYYKTIKDVESDAMRVGNMIHETAEHYLKSLTSQKFLQNKIHSQYLTTVKPYCDAMAASGGEIHVEREMCFDKAFKPCGWRDWNTVWVRSKADVIVKKGNKISILDWKTGKYKEDFLQLEMFAVFAALTPGFEDIEEFDPKFIFTKEAAPKNILRIRQPIKRSDLKEKLGNILAIVRRMEAAWESGTFPAKKNGLCRQYCAILECAHCGRN